MSIKRLETAAIVTAILVAMTSCGNTNDAILQDNSMGQVEAVSPTAISESEAEPPSLSAVTQSPHTVDETLERYYDYVQCNPQIIALFNHSSAEKRFSDDEMAAFSIITMKNLGYIDYTNGNSKEEFDEITEKYFDSRIENFNNSTSQIIPETGMIISTGWDYPRVYMVLKDLSEKPEGVREATFYRVIRLPGDEWGDDDPVKKRANDDTVKHDLLAGNFYGYGPVYLVEIKFAEKYDESGDMYFQFQAVNQISETKETIVPYGTKQA